jgi:hypothetical protein
MPLFLINEQIHESLLSTYQHLLNIGRKLAYFVQSNDKTNGSHKSSNSTINWSDMCDMDKIMPSLSSDYDHVELSEDCIHKSVDVFGKVVTNVTSCDMHVIICSIPVIIPSQSTFLLSDITKIEHLTNYSTAKGIKYNMIVIDPPWENRSAIRSSQYKWLDKYDICHLPVNQLLSDGGLVAIWVTNKRQLVHWVIDHLIPHWSLEYIGEWTWIKVHILVTLMTS